MNSSIRTQGLVEIITHSALVNHWRRAQQVAAGGLRDSLSSWQGRCTTSRDAGRSVSRSPARPMMSLNCRHATSEQHPYLDAVTLLNDPGDELTLLVTNRHPSEALETKISLTGFAPRPTVTVQRLAPKNYLDANSPGLRT